MPPNDSPWIEGQKLELFIESFASSAFVVQVRGHSKSAIISGDHTTNSDRTLASSVIQIADIPENLTLRTAETSVSRGQCYVKVSLRAEGAVVALLFAGYVTDAGAPAFPNGKIESSVSGPGFIRSITGTDPAANTEISETVPIGARWRLVAMKVAFVADANAANRLSILVLTDGANEILRSNAGTSITTGQTAQLTWSDFGFRDTNTVSAFAGSIPNKILLPAAAAITTVTAAIQVGDNYGAPQLLVEEWLEP